MSEYYNIIVPQRWHLRMVEDIKRMVSLKDADDIRKSYEDLD